MKKQKKIFYLRTDLDAENLTAGGSVAHTLGVIQGFSSLGYLVIAASSAMHGMFKQMNLSSCTPLRVPRLFRIAGFKIACFMSNISFYMTTIKLIQKNRDIQFIYQRYSLLNCVGVLLSWRTKTPLVLEFNGSEAWVDTHWTKNARLRLRWLVNKIEQINLKHAHTILVVSQALKDMLVEQGVSPHKILVHPNGVDVDVFDPYKLEDKRNEIRANLGVHGCVVFGFIGTFSYWHGIDVIGEMIPPILGQWPNARFLLIGDGILRTPLQHKLLQQGIDSSKIIFLGTVPQEQARNYLAACDAFLSPTQPNPDGTRFFGSPTKLFEYMSLAKPIIASDIEQLSEVIFPAFKICSSEMSTKNIENYIGLLVEPHDVNGFIQAANIILTSNKNKLECMGSNARKKVVEYYTWHHHTQALENYLTIRRDNTYDA